VTWRVPSGPAACAGEGCAGGDNDSRVELTCPPETSPGEVLHLGAFQERSRDEGQESKCGSGDPHFARDGSAAGRRLKIDPALKVRSVDGSHIRGGEGADGKAESKDITIEEYLSIMGTGSTGAGRTATDRPGGSAKAAPGGATTVLHPPTGGHFQTRDCDDAVGTYCPAAGRCFLKKSTTSLR
jgi:hypothetical protein